MPGDIQYQVIIQAYSEMTFCDSWYLCTAFKRDRYTETDCSCDFGFLVVIQQYENLKMYWQSPDAFVSSHYNWKF